MALEAIITVTLGLLIIWIVLSVATNMIRDWIGMRLDKSAQDTYVAIASMIQDADLLRKFYDHSVILSLTLGRRKQRSTIPSWFSKYPVLRGYTKIKDIFPSFIPSAAFAEAMFDVFVYESLTPEEAKEDLSVARIQTSIERLQLSKPQLSQVLGRLFPRLDRPSILDLKIAECKKNIENWYNYSTVYLADTQRRYEEAMALLLGFIIALLLNIDMISMAIQLWREPTVRQIMVNASSSFNLSSEEIQYNPTQALYNFNQQFIGLQPPIGWIINQSDGMAFSDRYCQLFPGENQAFGVPVIASNKCIAPPQSNNQTNILLKLIGIMITALAARQGAPFWSDILKRLVSRVQQVGKQ